MSTKLITYKELCEHLNRNYKTIQGWVRDGKFPQPVRVSGRTVGWRQEDVAQWINDNVG
ncbi:helix-turn-helix transcriptional regulator [Vibrio sp. 10N.222.52.C3]|uniref:helix-turn-helix transcriptional regulator n=1 Tax=Vibrio sp. 10N.222.52.C3 TaxID=3229631 RepID=UPI00354B3206